MMACMYEINIAYMSNISWMLGWSKTNWYSQKGMFPEFTFWIIFNYAISQFCCTICMHKLYTSHNDSYSYTVMYIFRRTLKRSWPHSLYKESTMSESWRPKYDDPSLLYFNPDLYKGQYFQQERSLQRDNQNLKAHYLVIQHPSYLKAWRWEKLLSFYTIVFVFTQSNRPVEMRRLNSWSHTS